MASRTAYSTWTPQKPTLFDGHYLRNRSNLDIGVLGYIGIVYHKEHPPEVWHVPPGTPCIHNSSYKALVMVVSCQSNFNSPTYYRKKLSIKFHENPSSGSRGLPCGKTDRQIDMTKLIVAFHHLTNAPKNASAYSTDSTELFCHKRQWANDI